MKNTGTIIDQVRREGRLQLTETEAKLAVESAGIPVTMPRLATSPQEAASIAQETGFPVVLKIESPDVVHKSDASGVVLSLDTPDQVSSAFGNIIESVSRKAPEATISGISVQRMAPPGIEVIIGVSTDPQFGHVIMFGLGGILVEMLRDVAFRVVPITSWDAEQMVREVKGYRLLQGFRGQPPADLDALARTLVAVSRLVEENREIAEMDMNPVFAYPDGVVAVDARMTLSPSAVPEVDR